MQAFTRSEAILHLLNDFDNNNTLYERKVSIEGRDLSESKSDLISIVVAVE